LRNQEPPAAVRRARRLGFTRSIHDGDGEDGDALTVRTVVDGNSSVVRRVSRVAYVSCSENAAGDDATNTSGVPP